VPVNPSPDGRSPLPLLNLFDILIVISVFCAKMDENENT